VRNAYKILVGKPEGKRTLGRPRHRWEDTIKMDVREMGVGRKVWIHLSQNRCHWQAVVSMLINLEVP
jgi:hypothetical protein